MARFAVVGAGWAGLSAALRLLADGHQCSVFEAAPQPGGRARRVSWQCGDGTLAIDNGQHILLGAYRETLELLALAGVDASQVLRRLPLCLTGRDWRLRAPPWPAPLHMLAALAGARGFSWAERWALVRFMTALRRAGWRVPADCTVSALLATHRQPEGVCRRLWRPLCLAALNTPPEQAAAQVFCTVLRDSLGGARRASDLLLPAADLSALLPDAAARRIAAAGQLRLSTTVTGLREQVDGLVLELQDGSLSERHAGVVLATPARAAARLLATLPDCGELAARCGALTHQSITTAWLRYPVAPGQQRLLAEPMVALDDDPRHGRHGQWAFDRMALCGQAGLIALPISAEGPHRALSPAALCASLHAQLRDQAGLHAPLQAWRVLTEKRATFACTPGLDRPGVLTPVAHLVLAGDWCASDYPATLESAVASGRRAAAVLAAGA